MSFCFVRETKQTKKCAKMFRYDTNCVYKKQTINKCVCLPSINLYFFEIQWYFVLCFFHYYIIEWSPKNLFLESIFNHKQNLALIKMRLSQNTISKNVLLRWVFFNLISFNIYNEGQNILPLSNNNSLQDTSGFGKQIFMFDVRLN